MEIPNYGRIEFRAVLFDLNGTLGESGRVDDEVKHLLERLADRYTVVVLSADTFGTLEDELRGLPVRIERVSSGTEKARIAEGYKPYAAVGNGNNDVAMLEGAELAFCVIGPEGASIDALLASDVVVRDVKDAIGMILDEKKLIATLRG
ncbi:HAD family hydrolase [Thermococcus thioreducens]|uniref:HAD family hydrolase n=1 Tax=Thermococcus thioreducens TaxID=277988 RepID=A0A0Q2S4T0_9EURY|nr:HAD family hydrolase [Thermococcus thioreducens]ASJ12532.1 HAD family hydrolase [Thermococcus thioreducens]KQH82467.1 HAD family hydrolase [Thermococcus thioreducens]SEV89247.1 Soluble P-type ATPase [Thermococcus thioreducens]